MQGPSVKPASKKKAVAAAGVSSGVSIAFAHDEPKKYKAALVGAASLGAYGGYKYSHSKHNPGNHSNRRVNGNHGKKLKH